MRACGDFMPLVAEVEAVLRPGVWVRLHDPDGRRRPQRVPGAQLDDVEAESGRGLPLMDLLAPGWDVVTTPIGKQVRCLVPKDFDQDFGEGFGASAEGGEALNVTPARLRATHL